MVLVESIILLLLHNQVLFLLLQLLLQKVDQIFVALRKVINCIILEVPTLANPVALHAGLEVGFLPAATLRRILPLVQVVHLRLESLDDFLAEVGSLRQLLLHLFVDFDFALVCLNLLLHLVVLED